MNTPNHLPEKIMVKIINEKKGCIFAELTDYGVFTEADDFDHLVSNVNDLIYTFFDIKPKDQHKFWYMPQAILRHNEKESRESCDPVMFHVLTSPASNYSFA